MKLSYLHAFRAVVECQTVTAAAELLNLSQPAVSRLLSSLEEQLKFKLFIRQRSRLILSDEGQAFYLEVAKVFDAVNGLDSAAEAIRTHHLGSLTIAAMPVLSHAFLPRILANFLQHNCQTKIGLKTFRSEDVVRQIQAQTTDIGFAFTTEDVAGVNSQTVTCECVALIPAASPLAQKATISVTDLGNECVIRHEKDMIQRCIDNLLRRHDIKINKQIEVSLASTAAALVAEGVGIAITDPFTAYLANETRDVVMRPLAFNLAFEFTILYPGLRPIHRHAERFIEQFMLTADSMDIYLKIGPMHSLA
ncbi:LysR family transcriptional regulator [Photobacterium toruni]|uniref:HTH-type transcriptional activator CmpR n=1 Tax=Photobacterium toruni TaxID=1935446 RepID=A0A1T4PYA9_9GAMM|nr:LysR substrate-binding domain-containing protein [Photobacterium toruni]SJZ96469.1 HTH-type transcriptional activator CmpR [Photobacterium toruni]